MRIIAVICILLLSTSCATPRGRFMLGAGIGAVAMGGTATALSPNQESRGMNAFVFGLLGAFLGGLVGLFTGDDGKVPKNENSIKAKEQASLELSQEASRKLYEVSVSQDLPGFVKERLQPTLVEESIERATVSEDGSLHQPHQTYRIYRNAELSAEPIYKPNSEGENNNERNK